MADVYLLLAMRHQGASLVGDGWGQGPLPDIRGASATEAERRQYFSSRAGSLLFGDADDGRRRHIKCDGKQDIFGFDLIALESLTLPIGCLPSSGRDGDLIGVLILHLDASRVSGNLATKVRSLRTSPGTVFMALQPILGRIGYASSEAFSFVVVCQEEGGDRERTAWETSSGLDFNELEPSENDKAHSSSSWSISPSRDWDFMVLRDGGALVYEPGDTKLKQDLRRYAGAIYLDVLIAAFLQRLTIQAWSDWSAGIHDSGSIGNVAESGFSLARMRSQLWWRDISTAATGNQILRIYHDQHGIADSMELLVAEVDYFSRIVSERRDSQTNVALGVLAVVGLPLAVTLEVWSVLCPHPVGLAVAVLIAAVLSMLLLVTIPSFRGVFISNQRDEPR